MKKLFVIGFVFLMMLTSAFSLQWFESFDDLTNVSANFVSDNGTTSWNATNTFNLIGYHGIATRLGTQAFYINNARTSFETEVIETYDAINDVDVSLIYAILDVKDKFDGDDYIRVFVRANGGIPALAFEQKLDAVDGAEFVDIGQLVQFTVSPSNFSLIITADANHPDEKFAFDNILVSWINESGTQGENIINVNTNFTANITSNVIVNSTVINNINTSVIVNLQDNDTFSPFVSDFGQVPQMCPLNEGNNDRTFFMFMIAIAIILFIFAFWLDNAMIGILASLMLLYIGFISAPCDVFISGIMIVISFVGIVLSITQLEFAKT